MTENYIDRFLATDRGGRLLQERDKVVGAIGDEAKGYIKIDFISPDPQNGFGRRWFFETHILQDDSFMERTVFEYDRLPWIKPHFRVAFSDRQNLRFKSVESEPIFYRVRENGITADRREICFVSSFGDGSTNEHKFQASYYARAEEGRFRGQLAYCLYLSPFLGDPSNFDPNQDLEERIFTRSWDSREIRVALNKDNRYDLQFTDTGLIRLETQRSDLPEKAIMICSDSIDVDRLEALIMAPGDEWTTELSRNLWPISYWVKPNV